MSEYTPTAEVQLEGEDLERARELIEQARSSLRQAQGRLAELGTLVARSLNDDSTAGTVEISQLLADTADGSVVVCYYDSTTGACKYCMQDPPGISRPCGESKPGPKSPGPVYLKM
ncbi:MAG: hypothetical protein ACRDOY_04980 [Nocardioidaceae bacterium]